MDIHYGLWLLMAVSICIFITFYVKIVIDNRGKNQKVNRINGERHILQNGENNTNIKIDTINNNYTTVNRNVNTDEVSIDRIKNDLKVIFVDDKKFNVVELLKKSGWNQVLYKKDILDINSPEIREAHVFFLDINGVGKAMGFHNQGMGLCGAIKRKYGENKRVVLYSGETDGNIFDDDAKMADDTLKKDSDLYQFTTLMEQYGKELL